MPSANVGRSAISSPYPAAIYYTGASDRFCRNSGNVAHSSYLSISIIQIFPVISPKLKTS